MAKNFAKPKSKIIVIISTPTTLEELMDALMNRYWTLFFSASLIAFIAVIILLFLKGGIIGAIAATVILIKIWDA